MKASALSLVVTLVASLVVSLVVSLVPSRGLSADHPNPALSAVRYLVAASAECARMSSSNGYAGCSGEIADELYGLLLQVYQHDAAGRQPTVASYLGEAVRVLPTGSVFATLSHRSLGTVPFVAVSCHLALDDPNAIACLIEPRRTP